MRIDDPPAQVRQPTLLLRATEGTLAPDRGFLLAADDAQRLGRIMPACQMMDIAGTNHYTIMLAEQRQREVAQFLASGS